MYITYSEESINVGRMVDNQLEVQWRLGNLIVFLIVKPNTIPFLFWGFPGLLLLVHRDLIKHELFKRVALIFTLRRRV